MGISPIPHPLGNPRDPDHLRRSRQRAVGNRRDQQEGCDEEEAGHGNEEARDERRGSRAEPSFWEEARKTESLANSPEGATALWEQSGVKPES